MIIKNLKFWAIVGFVGDTLERFPKNVKRFFDKKRSVNKELEKFLFRACLNRSYILIEINQHRD